MYLKRLEIQGFKSFANKTLLHFESGITAIVGPNGSGKSNVADSIRWVLGEQSTKLLRGKKADDVVFAGSDKKARMGFAEVSAVFDNHDKRIPLDASEVVFSRRIDRSGNSEYLINGVKSRLQDIVELVLKSGIGTSRYTVIGQGTIDQLILSGPVEIKNLIDEASGVKTYHIKRDKTLRKLEATINNLSRSKEILAEIEPRLRLLKRQVKKVEERAVYEKELVLLLREDFALTLQDIDKHLMRIKESIVLSEVEIKEKSAIAFELNRKTEDDNIKTRGLNDRFNELQVILKNKQSKKQSLVESIGILKGRLASGNLSTEDPGQLTNKILELEQNISTKQSLLDDLQKEISLLTSELDQKKVQYDEVVKKFNALYADLHKPVAKKENIEYSQYFNGIDNKLEHLTMFVQEMHVDDVRRALLEIRKMLADFRGHTEEVSVVGREDLVVELNSLMLFKDGLSQEQNDLQNKFNLKSSEAGQLKLLIKDFSSEMIEVRRRLVLAKERAGASADVVKGSLETELSFAYQTLQSITEDIQKTEIEMKELLDTQKMYQEAAYQQEKQKAQIQSVLSEINHKLSMLQVEKARIDTRAEGVVDDIVKSFGADISKELVLYVPTEVTEGRSDKISRLQKQLELIGGVEEGVMAEYEEISGRYDFLNSQIIDLSKSMEDLQETMEELDKQIKTKFTHSVSMINEKFEYFFKILFRGGRATLVSVSDKKEEGQNEEEIKEDVLAKYKKSFDIVGVDIKATPPGKKLSNIQALSGGERSLTAIALLCSLLSCFPSPVVVLDEVDAALDDANTIRFGEIIGHLIDKTQFITITHNRETMSRSKILYGVTMGDDSVSKLLSVKLDQAKMYAK